MVSAHRSRRKLEAARPVRAGTEDSMVVENLNSGWREPSVGSLKKCLERRVELLQSAALQQQRHQVAFAVSDRCKLAEAALCKWAEAAECLAEGIALCRLVVVARYTVVAVVAGRQDWDALGEK